MIADHVRLEARKVERQAISLRMAGVTRVRLSPRAWERLDRLVWEYNLVNGIAVEIPRAQRLVICGIVVEPRTRTTSRI